MLNGRISPIRDEYIEKFLLEKALDLKATTDLEEAYSTAELVIVATQTNYDPTTNCFDTSAVEAVIEAARQYNDNAFIVIKSMVPVEYTKRIREQYKSNRIIFSPEFLRESKALYDNLFPSRIIVTRDDCDSCLIHEQKVLGFGSYENVLSERNVHEIYGDNVMIDQNKNIVLNIKKKE